MSEESNGRAWKDYLLFVLAIAVFVIYIIWTDAFNLIQNPPDFRLRYVFLAIIINFSLQLIISFRFGYMLHMVGNRFSYAENLYRHLVLPLLARITPGQLGMAYKVTLTDVKRDEALFVHFLERVGDFIILTTTASLSILFVDRQYRMYLLAIVIIFLSISFILIFLGDRIIDLIPIKINLQKDWIASNLRKFGYKRILKFVLLALLAWTVTICLYLSLASSIGLSLSFFKFGVAIATTYVLAALTGLPGGLGAREFSLTFILTQFSVPEELAVTFTLLNTGFVVFNEMIYFIIGQFGLFVQRRKDIEIIGETESSD